MKTSLLSDLLSLFPFDIALQTVKVPPFCICLVLSSPLLLLQCLPGLVKLEYRLQTLGIHVKPEEALLVRA